MDFSVLKNELDSCTNPLFFFDDDTDGLGSFLLCRQYKGEGKGIVLKMRPTLDSAYHKQIEDYNPDKIFVLDAHTIDDSFFEGLKIPVVWVDHHAPQQKKVSVYINPKKEDPENMMCTSEIVYRALGGELWIAMVGIIGDWTFPKDLIEQFHQEHPDLCPSNIKTAPQALFDSPFAWMVRCYQFNLKGRSKDYGKSTELFIGIKHPNELKRENKGIAHIFKQYDKYNETYQELLQESFECVTDDNLIVFVYSGSQSFTGEISNELLYKYPEKINVVARNSNGTYKCSFRSSPDKSMYTILQNALKGIEGRGGGHDQACGGTISEEDWDQFLNNLRDEI